MAGFVGWGSFGQDLFQGTFERQPPRTGWDDEAKWLRDHLGKEAWESAKNSIINAHYTDPPTVQAVWDMVRQMGFRGGRVLEPSMGIGNFFGLMPRDIMAQSNLTGIELDRATAEMAALLYPEANVRQMGYQESKTPDDFYDLVIGNWPFASNGPADRRYDRLGPSLHDYFFLKALDQTRPGGLVVGITSAGTMDKVNRATRIELAKKGELIAAFRLPSGAFEKYAGTNVVTDLLVFRKRAEAPTNVMAEPWINTQDKYVPHGNIRLNDYYETHPSAVLGKLGFGSGTTSGRPGMIVHRPDNYMELLQALPSRVPAGAYEAPVRGSEPRFIANNTADRQNSITEGDGGHLYQVQGERLVRLDDVSKVMTAGSQKQQKERNEQVRRLISLRRAYGSLIDAERQGHPDTEKLRKALADGYAAFKDAHGLIGDSVGLKVMEHLNDPAYPQLCALEKPDGTPSRILTESITRSPNRNENPSISDAFVLARNEAIHIDLDRVAELAKKPRAEVEQHLVDTGAVLRTPGGGVEAKDIYLSGNVRRKLAEAEQALARGENMQMSVDALKEVLPPTVPYHQIEASLGATWIGDRTYKQFLTELLGLPSHQADDVRIRFAHGRWLVRFDDPHINFRQEAMTHGHERSRWDRAARFDKIMAAAMGNVTIKIYDQDDDGAHFNEKVTEEVNAKVQALRERFVDWLWAKPERKIAMEKAYNEIMNAVAKPHFDGSFMDMSGMALRRGEDQFSLRQHQINAIWRGVVMGRGLFAHEVGTGKTMVMGGLAVEGRRYGRFRKPLILAHNANSSAVAREIGEMYPGAKILYIDNLSPAEIKTKLYRVSHDDWDAVVMPHSVIDKLTLQRETLMGMAQEQITELENEAMDAAREDNVRLTPEMMDDPEAMKKVRSPTAKQLVHQRNRILTNIEKQATRASAEGAVPFETLGIDAVIVDEVHEFKKPPISTRMQMRGLNKEPSDRSIALNFLLDYTGRNNSNRGVFLFTGTPITNTLGEIFHQSRYFMRDAMTAAGVRDWDSWFNTFAQAQTDVELNASGEYEPVTRISAFVNTDELVRMMSEYTDVVQAKDMPEFRPRPTTEGRTPKAEGRPFKKIVTDVADMSPRQRELFEDIASRAREFKTYGPRDRNDIRKTKGGHPLAPMTTDREANATGLDPRLLDQSAPDNPLHKINRVVRRVMEHYAEPGAGQVIFIEQGYNPNKMAREAAAADAEAGIASARRPFVFVREMIDKLVAQGVPRDEIAIVAGGVDAEEKKRVADAMNAGTIRVVIGQTQTLGVGVNMQKNLRAMHHVDAPWMPGELEQRNGRGERQGNEWNTVFEYRYITEGADGNRWQLLQKKDAFIKRFMNAFNDNSRKRIGSLEGEAADMSENEDITQTLSAAAGDPRLMIRKKLESDVSRLERRERMHAMGIADALESAERLQQGMESYRRTIDGANNAMTTWSAGEERAQQAATAAGATHRWYEADVQGQQVHTGAEIEAAIDSVVSTIARGDTNILVATINGFRVVADWPGNNLRQASPKFELIPPGQNNGIEMGGSGMQSILAAVRKIREVSRDEARVARMQESIDRLKETAAEPFPKQQQLFDTRKRLRLLIDDLQRNPTPPPGWLRYTAPIDTTIYVNGKPRTVRGHAMDDDYKIITDEGDVPYLEAKDENGQRLFEPHDPPPPPISAEEHQFRSQLMDPKQGVTSFNHQTWQVVEGDGGGFALEHVDYRPRNPVTNTITGPDDSRMSRRDLVEMVIAQLFPKKPRERAKPLPPPARASALIPWSFTNGEPGGQLRISTEGERDKPQFQRAGNQGLPLFKGDAQQPGGDVPNVQAMEALAKAFQQIVGPHVQIELRHEDVIHTLPDGTEVRQPGLAIREADGTYSAANGLALGRLIRAAIRPGLQQTLGHESLHVLRNLGVFTDAEWNALRRAAVHRGWLKEYDVAGRWPNSSPELQIEEAIAEKFGDFLTQPRPTDPFLLRIANKFLDFLERVRNALAGDGFRTAHDVFRQAIAGEVGAREPGSGMPQRGPTSVEDAEAQIEHWHSTKGDGDQPRFQRPDMTDEERRTDTAARRERRLARLPARGDLTPPPAHKEIGQEIRSVLAPTSVGGEQTKIMERDVRRYAAELALSSQRSAEALEEAREVARRLSVDEQLDMNHRAETGQPQRTPELEKAMGALRRVQAEWLEKVRSLSPDLLTETIDNYMGHMYSNYREWAAGQLDNLTPAQKAARARVLAATKRPLRGSGEFLKKRTFPTLEDAMAAGLQPVVTNPIDMQLLKVRSMQRFYHGWLFAEHLKRSGMLTWVPISDEHEALARGMGKLDDSIFQPRRRSDAEYGLIESGNWMAPVPAARIFNNYMSRSALMTVTPRLYGALRKSGNVLNGIELGMSGFHATFVALDSIHSQTALALQQAMRGQLGKAAATAVGAPAAPVRTLVQGNKLRHAALHPGEASAEMRPIVNALISGGGRLEYDKFFRATDAGSFFHSWKEVMSPQGAMREAWQMVKPNPAEGLTANASHILTGSMRVAFRALDTMMHPLMGYVVPRMKLGVFSNMARDYLETHPEASQAEVAEAMTKAWDSVDNRLGQLVYDNLFWHKTLKDVAFLTTRSVGWNVGTLRELGGAAVDTAHQAGRAAQIAATAARGRSIAGMSRPELTYRMAYAIAMTANTALIGAIMTKIATGMGPASLLDYFYPPDGTMTGNVPNRLSIPGYMKDVIDWTHAPIQTAQNKANPLLSTVSELVSNRDYYGGSIYDPERDTDPFHAYGKYLLNQAMPFSVRAMMRLNRNNATPLQQMLGFWGIQPAPQSIVNPAKGEAFQRRDDAKAYKARMKEDAKQGRVELPF